MTARPGVGAGAGCVIARTAAAASSRPPVATLPERAATGLTVERSADRISAAVALGFAAAMSATVPVTYGVAIDVPLKLA